MNKDKFYEEQDTVHLEDCENEPVKPLTAPHGKKVIDVPVTLAELTVKTNVVTKIHFPEPVLEIKDIKKNVKIIQCRLLLPGFPDHHHNDHFPFDRRDLKLFIKGFVRKNIQYATPCGSKYDGVSSTIRSLTKDVPFECITTIKAKDFLTPPQLPFHNNRSEFDFFRAQELGKGYPEKDMLLSNDLSQYHQVSNQYYNRLPYCELLGSSIVEWDEAIDRCAFPGDSPIGEGYFENVIEKMFLEFTIKVLQEQQVRVKSY